VFSAEAPVFAQPDGSVCDQRPAATAEGSRLNCNGGLGSAVFVTGTFGFAAAGRVVASIAGASGKD
jgi:tRNA A37 threonylcarbamoyladenosine dehydratase